MASGYLLQMVRVCRAFQKYTGSDEIIICNINSKYAPKFHIHPNLLASNFFERRQQFYDELKNIVDTIDDDDELFEYLEDEEVSFMLHHFGIQTVIRKVNKYKAKLEKHKEFEHEFDSDTSDSVDKHNNQSNSSLTQSPHKKRRRRNLKSFHDKINKKPLLRILWWLLRIRNTEKLAHLPMDLVSDRLRWMLCVGIEAHAHRRKMFKMITHSTHSQLEKKLKCVKFMDKKSRYRYMDKRQMILMCNHLRSWTTNGIKGVATVADDYREKAMKLTAKYFFNYYDCKLCHYPHIHNNQNYINYGAELLTCDLVSSSAFSSSTISNKHNYAKAIGILKICITNDLISRVKELNTLAVACILFDEYYIAVKMLRCSLKLCDGYICDETMEAKQIIGHICRLELLWWNKKCDNCKINAKSNKHKACIGCMKVLYCSRKCQKIDWNKRHRNICDNSWQSIYVALKMSIFDRL